MSGPDESHVAEALPHVERRLAAILSADVKEYSRLMGADDVATVEMLSAYREAMTALISQHRGRVVDSPGDNLLAQFSSVVDAVQCSVSIQEALNARNADLSADRRMDFRIGVNLGEVIVEGDRIYGDGVNIAARIQGLAEGGGVCISGSVCDEISSKLSFECESLGEQTLKNIEEAVRVYRVRASTRSETAPGVTLGRASPRVRVVRKTVRCRASVREHERRPGARALHRRPDRRYHHRSLEDRWAHGHRAYFSIHVQEQSGKDPRRRSRAGGAICSGGQRPEGR
jgi:class 3 adenylate cyclase